MNPKACPANQSLDVVFILDGSNSIGTENFKMMQQWVVSTSASLNISSNDVFVGVIVYSSFEYEFE